VQTVGRNIARGRAEEHLSQRDLAKRLDVDARDISRYENGHVMPSPERLAALGKALSRDIAWFYTDHDDAPVAA
jgi:transcriptional regulator with XRE-family HTH domain